MNRRSLFAAPLLLLLPGMARAPLPSEVRVFLPPATLRRMAARLAVPVRALPGGAAEALNRGHLELALLDGAELARARALMGDRLLVLRPAGSGTLVTRRVLPPALRAELAAALV